MGISTTPEGFLPFGASCGIVGLSTVGCSFRDEKLGWPLYGGAICFWCGELILLRFCSFASAACALIFAVVFADSSAVFLRTPAHGGFLAAHEEESLLAPTAHQVGVCGRAVPGWFSSHSITISCRGASSQGINIFQFSA